MGVRERGVLLVGFCLAWAAAAPPVWGQGANPLDLTNLQREVLHRVFEQHTFEAPAPPSADADLGVRVDPTAPGGLYRMGPEGDLPLLRVAIRSVGSLEPVGLAYRVVNFYGQKVAEGALGPAVPDEHGMAALSLVLEDITRAGYYHVLVTGESGGRTASGACGVVIVPPVDNEPRTKNPFGFAGWNYDAESAEVAARLGAQRLVFDWPYEAHPEGSSAEVRERIDLAHNRGLALTGIIPLTPADDPGPFALMNTAVVQRYAETIPDWQIGSRLDWPSGLFGPVESPGRYREMVCSLIEGLRRAEAPVSIWVAATPGFLADVLTEGPVLAGADGVSLYVEASARGGDTPHPESAREPNLRSGAFRRSLDYGIRVARRLGVKRAVVAGVGDGPGIGSPQQRAWKLVTRHVLTLAAGAERVFVRPECLMDETPGWRSPLPEAAAYAWMTHLLAPVSYKGDLWADVPLLEAHLFSGVGQRVVVVWSWIGQDAAEPDRGALVFEKGGGLEAYDVVGRPVGIWKGPRLVVPLGEAPVYVTSPSLRADEMRELFRRARVVGLDPATLWIRGVVRGEAPGRVRVNVWVQSHLPHRAEGRVGLVVPEGWRARQAKHRFSLEAGEAREFTFECDVAEEAAPAPYRIEAAATLDEAWVRRTFQVQVAQAPQRSITVGGGLADWEGIRPVRLADDATGTSAEVRTAWDREFFYFSAVVHRERETFLGGPHAFSGDAIQLGFGLSERADDDFGSRGRGKGLPAGAFRDTDHLFALTFGPEGPRVIRLRAPRCALRTHVPGNMDSWYGPVEGAKVLVGRDHDAGVTIYEAAIPMAAIEPLRGERGRVFRFGFRIGDGRNAPLEWARTAGVPDYLANPASFLPTGGASLPCQTRWALVGPRAGPEEP